MGARISEIRLAPQWVQLPQRRLGHAAEVPLLEEPAHVLRHQALTVWPVRVLLVLAVLATATGCGGDGGEAGTPASNRTLSDRLVDFSKKPPYVNALDVDPATGDYLLTTNRGFWRIDPDTDKVERVTGKVTAEGGSSRSGRSSSCWSPGPASCSAPDIRTPRRSCRRTWA